jgi:nucleotide-binding universal stress UspA family protein
LFARQGVSVELKTVQSRDSIPNALGHAANELDASFVVMGAYGRWRLRQLILGNCTENALRCIERPILLMH